MLPINFSYVVINLKGPISKTADRQHFVPNFLNRPRKLVLPGELMLETQTETRKVVRPIFLVLILFTVLLASAPASAKKTVSQFVGVSCSENSGNVDCYVCTEAYGGSLPALWRPAGVVGVQTGTIPDTSHPGSFDQGIRVGLTAGECP